MFANALNRPDLRARVITGAGLILGFFGLTLFASFTCIGLSLLCLIVVLGSAVSAWECVRLFEKSRVGILLLCSVLIFPALFVWAFFVSAPCPVGTSAQDSTSVLAVTAQASILLRTGRDLVLVTSALFGIFFISAVFLVVRSLWTRDSAALALQTLAPSMLALIHVGLGSASLLAIVTGHSGVLWLAYVVAVVACGDIGAYFVGSACGGPKLLEHVSPKKTWSGAGGGLVSSMTVSILAGAMLFDGFNFWSFLVMGLALGVTGQVGDLMKSALKRIAGVKDSGTLLPGHGGLYDRFDGLFCASTMLIGVFALVSIFGGGT